jgi:hypothetical protein
MKEPQLTEKQLQALLRLKRHEQPPPGYFDDLLANIHRRQREELLRRPAWRIFVDRVRAFFASMDWNYAASMGAILLIGVGAIQMALPTKKSDSVAKQSSPLSPAHAGADVRPVSEPMITLQPGAPVFDIRKARRPASATPAGAQGPTRFVIEAQPSSYAPEQIRF